ncbi:MAG: flagellar basal body rod protein FlgC [Alphaproteobacteria bacterium]
MSLEKVLGISASGMTVQAARLRIVAENIANSQSLGDTPGGDPYRRKMITFKTVLDENIGAQVVRVDRISFDASEFGRKHDPTHPAADKDGFVKVPNVKPLIEMMDLRESQRSYEANLSVIDVAKRMLQGTIDILRG